jgi:glycosyltransferase involved in cell wall biosynthesis
MSDEQRILYVQYTDPGNYPPLQHSARLLADAGWSVKLLGVKTGGANLDFPVHARIELKRAGAVSPGTLQKASYLMYAARVLGQVIRWKPAWVYASDLWSCPIALNALRFGCRVVYHEHDEPPRTGSIFVRACLRARRRLTRRAAACVIPNEQRRVRFMEEHPEANTIQVWNCPLLAEVPPARAPARESKPFLLYYHGSIGAPLVPATLLGALRALPGDVRLRLVGYETIGSHGYIDALRLQARNLGIEQRIDWKGSLHRSQLWPAMRDADVGVSLVPMKPSEPNLDALAGASNKTFDYLAAGLALLITDRPDWTEIFGQYGAACDPDSVESIAAAIMKLYTDRAATRAIGQAGRDRILEEWHYARQFQQVRELLDA